MKKILITGATDGIGFETAKLLAAQNHHLLLHGRSEQKLSKTIDYLQKSFPKTKVAGYLADLSSFDDIHQLVQSIKDTHNSIDIIINNAGVFKAPSALTADGLDVRFVVNTIAPYILTMALLPLLQEDGRIINLSSAAQAPVSLDSLTGKQTIRDAFEAYAQSKLAITIWSQELAKTLSANQVVVAVNPGSLLGSKMVKEGFGTAGNDLRIGADILAHAALSEEFSKASGKYFDNDSKQFTSPHPYALEQSNRDNVVRALQDVVSKFFNSSEQQ